jgi:hypothetical protein
MYPCTVGQVVATDYGLDGMGIESPWGRLSTPVQTAHPASCTMSTGCFPGVESGREVMLTTPPSSAEV